MQETVKKLQLRVRMPDTHEIAKAWEGFMEDKVAMKMQVTDWHTLYFFTAYKYLRQQEGRVQENLISPSTCSAALSAIGYLPESATSRVLAVDPSFPELAMELYRVLEEQHPSTDGALDSNLVSPLLALTRALSFSGHTAAAREELEKYLGQDGQPDLTQHWRAIVKGYAKEKSAKEISATGELLKKEAPEVYTELRQVFLETYAELDAMDDASTAFFEIADSMELNVATYKAMFLACARNNDVDFGHSLARTITESGAINRTGYNALVLMWALDTGRSVSEVDRMLAVMRQRHPELTPDAGLIEVLLDSNTASKDPYLAEKIFQLCSKWKVTPNNWIWKRMVESRLAAGDIDGAHDACREFDAEPESIPWHRDACLNKIIVAMIKSKKYDFEPIMTASEELSKRGGEFQLETVAALLRLHLLRKEYHDAVDLLNTHVPMCFIEDRKHLRDLCVEICLDRRNKIMNCWDTYMIFHQVFDLEVDRPLRTKVMNEFFARRRSDMAVHVFDHMRTHWRADAQVTVDTYVDAYVGVARSPDGEALSSVHNYLKLDTNIDPDVRLYNAMMLAFVESDEPRQALPFWREIISGPEGPDAKSIRIIFQVSEKIPFGDEFAAVVWDQLQSAKIEVTPEMLTAYIGALAANDNIEPAKDMLERWGNAKVAKAGLDAQIQL